jgi:hypothetical protein
VIHEVRGGEVVCTGTYRGNWKFGLRHGFGRQDALDGSYYEGEWRYDQPYGRGREIDVAGGKFLGCWHAGERHGTGFFHWPGQGSFIEAQQYLHGRVIATRPVPAASAADLTGATLEAAIDALNKDAPVPAPKSVTATAGTGTEGFAPQEAPAAGGPLKLEGRKLLKKIRETDLPKWSGELKNFVGAEIEIDDKSFQESQNPNIAVWVLGLYDCVYTLQALVKAVKLMCPDEATRGDVRGALTKIILVSKEKVRDVEVSRTGTELTVAASFSAGESARLIPEKLKDAMFAKL